MSTIRPEVPLGLTLGDPCGIGPEIVLQCFLDGSADASKTVVFGPAAALQRAQDAWLRRAGSGVSLPIVVIDDPGELAQVPSRCVPVIEPDPGTDVLPPWGIASPVGGSLAARAIQAAVSACLDGQLAAITTAPISKEALSAAGYGFPGHTEMLQDLAARHQGVETAAVPVRMMLANADLRTVLCTVHTSLRRAIDAVTLPNVLETLQITHRALSSLLGRTPRIAVSALNPHAGEGGLFGREEIEIIAPAVALARAQGIEASGPWPPDTVFMRARGCPDFADVVVAMYHDQGLIPVKYLGLDDGVNVTLGLPFVRTSPDHGTAFDIAGRAQADASSLRKAMIMARRLSSSHGAVRGSTIS